MGGWTTRLFAALNAILPRLADTLLMRRYGAALRRFFDPPGGLPPGGLPPEPPARLRSGRGRTFGIALIAASFLAYGVLLGLPFLPLPGQAKLALAPVLVALGEATFWVGGALVGKEVVTRHRQYPDPRRWLCCLPSRADAALPALAAQHQTDANQPDRMNHDSHGARDKAQRYPLQFKEARRGGQ